MQKKRPNFSTFSLVSSEIFLLVLAIVSVGFIVGETNTVSAIYVPPADPYSTSPIGGTTPLGTGSSTAAASAASQIASVATVSHITPIPAGMAIGPGSQILSGTATLADGTVIGANALVPAGQVATVTSGGATIAAGGTVAQGGTTAAQFASAGGGATQTSGLSGIVDFAGNLFGGGIGGGVAPLVAGALWGGIAFGLIQIVGPLLTDDQRFVDALSWAALGGALGGGLVSTIVSTLGPTGFFAPVALQGGAAPGTLLGLGATPWGFLAGVGIGAAIFFYLYKEESVKVITLTCMPWEAPLGGSDCDKCNGDPFKPCSEYRCKSLGQACDLVNKGTNQEQCVWVSKFDVNSPTITPWTAVLTKGHQYVPDVARPSGLGTKIVSVGTSNGCIKPFTPLQFGVLTNEPAQCKVDYVHTGNYSTMQFYFGDSNYFSYNHTQKLSLPAPDTVTNSGLQIKNNGFYSLFVRCMDANGNYNVDEYAFSFCVDPSPDTTPPIIESTSIVSGSPVSFGIDKVPVTFFLNEPSECRWSVQDKDFNNMENNMTCSTDIFQQNANNLYPCSTQFTGVKNQIENKFFVRCKDQPNKPESERNVNAQSYPFVLKGTQSLLITKFGPNGTITGSTDVVQVNLTVETSMGADDGKSVCSFSTNPDSDSLVQMFQTQSFEHKQILSLTSGQYTYFFRCVDLGGNSAEAVTSFTVFTDKQPPIATRLYREGTDTLKLVTNEEATCSYSLSDCNFNFNEGIKMLQPAGVSKMQSFAQWNPLNTYYIKCQDNFGNQPVAGTCTVVASATNVN